MSRVRVLPDIIINKIAAGEVVERPASIVKELVENSLDAGSTRIFVDIEDGGKRQIKISDNGEGMEYEDALLAIERHATSKIISDADLFSINTLGFRGEALPSIASISRFSLETKTKTSQSGVSIHINGGKILNVEDSGCAPGTIISVKDIFFNTPARRKFLKTSPTEMAHITEILTCLALPWPSVNFRLSGDGKVVKNLPAVVSPFERAVDVLGRDLRGKMLYVERETEHVTLSGWISEPDVTRGSGQKIYIFVNGRYVKDRGIIHAMCDAYKGSLMKGRFPMAVLFMDLPNGTVDVNVHPTKQEVRFSNQRDIYGAVRAACHDALMKREAARNVPQRPQGSLAISNRAPKPYEPPIFRNTESYAKPVIPDITAKNADRVSSGKLSHDKLYSDKLPADKNDLPDKERQSLFKSAESASKDIKIPDVQELKASFDKTSFKENLPCDNDSLSKPVVEQEVQNLKQDQDLNRDLNLSQDLNGQGSIDEYRAEPEEQGYAEVLESLVTDDKAISADLSENMDLETQEANKDDYRYGEKASEAHSIFSSLKIIGQFKKSYILCDSASGLVIFDQHAAHERVVYERFQQMASGKLRPSVQRLLMPEIVEFSPKETLVLMEILQELSTSGIEIEHFGENSFAVRAVPSLLPENRIKDLLQDIIDRLIEFSGKKPDHEEIFGECFAVMACHAAIRSGHELAASDMKNLLNDLSLCGNPFHCPHGRPVYMVLSGDEMEKKFGRKG
ncbi:DNA mismatch repair endonuclease MutL [Desulforegula conservatrix]|uniref:DNA mismatch repair endonuclease MutL n=1 Tax=Desulforegula conservatrix TaxID=153026 RepID=UPI0003FF25E6|nr:DNA mismatch repair endonuclease MutL [Desulforegula conservatrix]